MNDKNKLTVTDAMVVRARSIRITSLNPAGYLHAEDARRVLDAALEKPAPPVDTALPLSDRDEGFRARKEKLTSANRDEAEARLLDAHRQSDAQTASYWSGWISADNES